MMEYYTHVNISGDKQIPKKRLEGTAKPAALFSAAQRKKSEK